MESNDFVLEYGSYSDPSEQFATIANKKAPTPILKSTSSFASQFSDKPKQPREIRTYGYSQNEPRREGSSYSGQRKTYHSRTSRSRSDSDNWKADKERNQSSEEESVKETDQREPSDNSPPPSESKESKQPRERSTGVHFKPIDGFDEINFSKEKGYKAIQAACAQLHHGQRLFQVYLAATNQSGKLDEFIRDDDDESKNNSSDDEGTLNR